MITTHRWTLKLCATLIAICCFVAAFPSQSDAYTPRYFTALYSNNYNKYQYYYSLWSVYGYDHNTYVYGYAYPYYYMYLAGYKADYWIWYYSQPSSLSSAKYWVNRYASYYSEYYAGLAEYYWNNY